MSVSSEYSPPVRSTAEYEPFSYEDSESARYDTLPSTSSWDSPWTSPVIPKHSNSYERTCKIAAIVAALAVMVIFSILIVGHGGFLFIPMVFIIGVCFLVYVMSTVSSNNAQARARPEYPPYQGFELRPME